MKIYKDIIQQTPEWYELRYGKVGGSTLALIMSNRGKPIRDNAVYKKLLTARFEDYNYEEGFTSSAMERGNSHEPLACAEFARIHEVVLEEYGWIEAENGLYGLSPDRLFDNMKQGVECKCPNGDTHTGYILRPMSMIEEYIWQIVHYFLCLEEFGFKKLHFISYRPENHIKPLLEQIVTKQTKVNISKKERYSILYLVVLARVRLIELETALSEDIANNKTLISF